MIVLAIDTSHDAGSAALADGGSLLGHENFGHEQSHMLGLGASVDKLLKQADLAIDVIDRIAVVSGPGSFTGLRIGMAFVKGLHAACHMSIVTMNALELLAVPVLEQREYAVSMIDARKDEVYAALYSKARKEGELWPQAVIRPEVLSPKRFLDLLTEKAAIEPDKTVVAFAGSGAARYKDVIKSSLGEKAEVLREAFPDTEILARRAEHLPALDAEEILSLEPFYIRSSGAKLKRLKEVKADG
jgi:tRNA threonylcarbamoyladenosine biosynthesis protein TsaB